MEGEGPEEGPLDEPGGPQLPVDTAWNPYAAQENYQLERRNQVMRRGGRGCMVPWILIASTTLVSVLALAGR